MFDFFGRGDPRKMPSHFFFGALGIDYSTAVLGDIGRQNYSVCPRHWYIDATFECVQCGSEFVFRAEEQRFWYEELGFWVDSRPNRCTNCRREQRRSKALSTGVRS